MTINSSTNYNLINNSYSSSNKQSTSNSTISTTFKSATNVEISKETLNQTTFISSRNNYYSESDKRKDMFEEYYSQVNEENKSFIDPKSHIYNKYYNEESPFYIDIDLTDKEREAGYDTEISYLEKGKSKMSYFVPIFHDLPLINGEVESLRGKAYNREQVNSQFNDLLNAYGINLPSDVKLTFTIDPYDYTVSVENSNNDNELSSSIENAINTADNGKQLYYHITSSFKDHNTQTNDEKDEKYSIFHEILEYTGYDLRELNEVDGKYLTDDGTDIFDIYKQSIMDNVPLLDTYKFEIIQNTYDKLSDLNKIGFDNLEDKVLSIEYENGSFYDIGQSKNYGLGQTEWIDKLEQSTLYYNTDEDNKDISINESFRDGVKSIFKDIDIDYDLSIKKDDPLTKEELIMKYLLRIEDEEDSNKKIKDLIDEIIEKENNLDSDFLEKLKAFKNYL